MGARKVFGAGLVLLLAVGLSGCTQADPAQVSTISATVKELDLDSVGGVVCEHVFEPHDIGSTVTYLRTIGVRGTGNVPELIDRLKKAGFEEDTEEGDPTETYLHGPHETTAVVLTAVPTVVGEKFSFDDQYKCPLPDAGITALILRPTDG